MKNCFLNPVRCLFAVMLFMGSTLILNAQSNNNMGIGTTSPDASAILHISANDKGLLIPTLTDGQQGGLTGPNGLLIYNSTRNRFNYYNNGWKPVGLWSINGDKIYYNTENVGIGTTNPELKLQVNGGTDLSLAGGGYIMTGLSTSSNLVMDVNELMARNNGVGTSLYLNRQGGDVLINNAGSGRVGIGTSPSNRLHVNGSESNGTNTATLQITNGTSDMFLDGNEIDTDGDLFINDNTNNQVKFGGQVLVGDPTDYNNVWFQVRGPDGNNQAAQFINNSPAVGGSSQPTVQINNTSGTGFALYIESGTVSKPGGGSWGANSDLRLKKDVESFTQGLESIRQIRPVWYRYNGINGLPTQPRYVGVIAQELQRVAPQMVSANAARANPESYLMVDPSDFTYMLINSVKELDQTVEKQKQIIEAQESKINAIEKALLKAGIKLD